MISDSLLVYAVIVFCVHLIWFIVLHDQSYDLGLCLCNPVWMYKNIKVNWFGAIFLTLLTNVIFGPSAVIYWIYKLCTVGRK